ncbi:MAG TPA: type II toxin-antitoxin system Phd/YefM family antitoxin [Candidatus Hydrogenedentes bacterium]|nr:type II toxin-antitoxin system Phd/YefM family antitoxin [Candidatus Hydrogenedentota bacterium]
MLDIHPSYIEKDGRAEFVVLAIEEFQALQQQMEDLEDLLDLRNAKQEEADAPTITLDQIKQKP